MRRTISLPAAALAALALAPATAAEASTVTREGDAYVFRADRASEIQVTSYDYVDDRIVFWSSGEEVTAFPDGCARESWDDADKVRCPQGFARVRVEGGAGDDDITISDDAIGTFSATVLGSGGDDTIRGRRTGGPQRDHYLGGDGDDTLVGGEAPELLEGGAGADELAGNEGADELHGGEGDDEVVGDSFSRAYPDVVDGGPGVDRSTSDWTAPSGDPQPYVTVTLDGRADDGRPGEGDDVTSVEDIVYNSAATFVAGAEPVSIALKEVPDGRSKLVGSDGDDRLRTPDSPDVIDGRGGDDEIEGGNGDDRITGGPGRDAILGDVGPGSCNFLVCRLPHGNDVIKVRDGARDSVDCGAGEDRVIADRKDVVASSCERVRRR